MKKKIKYSVKRYSELTGIKKITLYKQIHSGKIPFIKDEDGRYFIIVE